jgi:hypothetical protein
LLALGAGRGRQLGDPSLVALLAGGRLGLQQGLGLAQAGQPAGPGGQRGWELVAAGVAVLAVLALVGLGRPLEDLGDLVLELVVGAVGPLGGVGGQLGPVEGDGAEPDHPGGRAQLERCHEEPGQGLLVAGPEARDGDVVGRLVGGQHPEGDVFGAAAFDLAGGAHPDGVSVQQHAQQGLGVVGGVAVPVVAVGSVEGLKVELVDHVDHEPGEVAFGEPVAQVGWQQEGLVAVAAQEVVGYGPFHSFATFAPNASSRKC